MFLTSRYLSGNSQSSPSKLERKFDEKVQDERLKSLLPVIQGLMRFKPSDRISISQALDLVKAIPGETENEETENEETDEDG